MRFEDNWSTATLVSTRDLAPGIREFVLRPDGYVCVPYPVGSHIKLSVHIAGQPDVRSYSLVGEADPRGYRIAVRHAEDSRGGSRYLWSLQPGARIDVTSPTSLLQVGWQYQHYCLVAGGIGITPLVGAAQALLRRTPNVSLHYAVRSIGDAAYADELATLLGDRFSVYAADQAQRLDLAGLFAELPAGTAVLFCGPMRMLDAARSAWAACGRAPADLSYETFGSSGRLSTEPFKVRLRGSGEEIVVPRDRSMLDVLNAAGHEVMADCRRGECGVCAIDVVEVEGEIDHRDVFFSEEQKHESRKLCACVSRAHGVVTIDTLERADAL
ncbi:putative dioxygenase subunit beta [Bradyrhizobium sp. ORS 375]|uniref:PDR/VanB family oxidoreductase n=1 Tax=Bradyrhizobium sp. (strain ORS 375) TaxID=566679 RepID=UPI000240867C|nr:PDR/VanB family oxidoreductase [Bradyrhizobium sp. ORS 375]CCD96917.1 putative dioxygenase subunit beta [Bradyrhizobium sp. ORS 375]